MIKLKVVVNRDKEIEAVYDSGSNVTLVNYKLIDQLKSNIIKHQCLFKTLGGINFSRSRARLHMRINEIEEEMEVYVVQNDSFSYDLLLGLDAI